jgi:hypothetical protein
MFLDLAITVHRRGTRRIISCAVAAAICGGIGAAAVGSAAGEAPVTAQYFNDSRESGRNAVMGGAAASALQADIGWDGSGGGSSSGSGGAPGGEQPADIGWDCSGGVCAPGSTPA